MKGRLIVFFFALCSDFTCYGNEMCESAGHEKVEAEKKKEIMLSSDLAGIVVEVDGLDVYFTLQNEHNIGNIQITSFFLNFARSDARHDGCQYPDHFW